MDNFYRYTGTNGQHGLFTGNRYGISAEQHALDDEIEVRVYLANNPVHVGVQKYALKKPIAHAFVPYTDILYKDKPAFEADWQKVDDCRCTNPGEDDGGNTCWPHHDCTKGECTHGE